MFWRPPCCRNTSRYLSGASVSESFPQRFPPQLDPAAVLSRPIGLVRRLETVPSSLLLTGRSIGRRTLPRTVGGARLRSNACSFAPRIQGAGRRHRASTGQSQNKRGALFVPCIMAPKSGGPSVSQGTSSPLLPKVPSSLWMRTAPPPCGSPSPAALASALLLEGGDDAVLWFLSSQPSPSCFAARPAPFNSLQ
jgi:hypothetical protein